MSSSSAPAAKAAIVSMVAADPFFAGVSVTYTDPGAGNPPECVFTDRVEETEEAAALGQKRRDEKYDVHVVVGVTRGGNDAQGAEERSWALAGRLEDLVRQNTTLNGAVNLWAVVASMDQMPALMQGRRVSTIVVKVHCEHRK